MPQPIITPPFRTSLLTQNGTPLSTGNGDIQTTRDWWLYWQQLTDRGNANSRLATEGTHGERPNPDNMPDGALYYESDRGVLYANASGHWQYVAGTMWGTAGGPDQRPTDLGAADVGFDFRTNVSPAREFIWSGGRWIEVTPMLYGTHAQRLAGTIADLWAGMAWMETDRSNVIYQNQSGAWFYVAGTMTGLLANRPTGLGSADIGFRFESTDTRQGFRWSGSAWVETTGIGGAAGLTHPNVVVKVDTTTGQIVEGGITDQSAANSDKLHITAAGNIGIGTASPNYPLSFGTVVGRKIGLYDDGSVFYGIGTESGFVALISGSGGGLIFRVNGATEALRLNLSGGVAIPLLPASSPGGGSKQLYYDPADGNRVKFAP